MSSSGVAKDGFANSGTANQLASTYNNGAAQSGSVLYPTLQNMISNPQGYGQQGVANQTTAAMQSFGGSQAATVGQANLQAARTNNAGAYQAGIDDSARSNAAGLSNAALGVQNQNANVKLAQQQEGLSGMEGLYNTQVGAGENALGLSDQALNVANAGSNSAFNRILGGLNTVGSLGMDGVNSYTKLYGNGCWIAEAIYGTDDLRTHTARAYLNGEFRRTWTGDLTMKAYLRFGERVARWVRGSRLLRTLLRPVFDRALSNALASPDVLPRVLGLDSLESRKRLLRMLRPGPVPVRACRTTEVA